MKDVREVLKTSVLEACLGNVDQDRSAIVADCILEDLAEANLEIGPGWNTDMEIFKDGKPFIGYHVYHSRMENGKTPPVAGPFIYCWDGYKFSDTRIKPNIGKPIIPPCEVK